MAKFTLSLVVVVLAVLVDSGLSDLAGGWGQLRSGRPGFGEVGFGGGQCSGIKGIPDPKSGCCGKHAGTDGGNTGGDKNTGDGNDDDEDNTGDDNDYTPGGRSDGNDIDDGYGPGGRDDGNGLGDGGDDDYDSGDSDLDNGSDFDPDDLLGGLGNGIGDIDIDDIFGGNRWQFNEEYRNKRSADKNASDVAPDKFIIAGRPAGIAQYPWLVHLHVKIQDMMETKVIGCGGSLVSSRHVITAAHCLAHQIRNYDDVNIFLAEYNTRTYPTDCVGRQCIKNVIMHPEKISIHNGYQEGRLFNDIGMMKLRGSAPYTDYIRPICLPSFNINTARNEGTPLTITGWGQTENSQPSTVKLHTQVQLVAPNTCRRHYPDLTGGQLCAAGRSGQDTCMGDSGGPIMAEHEGNFYLVGLVSGKRSDAGCGSPVPTLYTNVFSHMKWIQNFMRN